MPDHADPALAGRVELSLLGVPVAVSAELAAAFTGIPAPIERQPALLEEMATATAVAVAASPYLCIHSGVVETARGLLVFPGESGLGKTTLVTALVRQGLGYLSDEALILDPDSGLARAFPRPLALSERSLELLGLVGPAAGRGPNQVEQLVPVTSLGRLGSPTGTVSDILLIQRRPGPVEIEAATAGSAVTALLASSFNHFKDPARYVQLVVATVRRAQVWQIRYAEAPELAAELVARFGRPEH